MEMDSGRRRRLLLMTLGVVLAIVAGAAAFFMANRPGTAPAEVVPTATVVVAAAEIPARTEITLDHVRTEEIPAEAKLDQTFTDVETVVGQTSGVPIYAGQQITPNLFVGTQDDQLGILPAGEEEITDDSPFYRAVSVSVPRQRAVGGQLQDGDRVDLIVTVELDAPLQAVEDENGNITYEQVASALAVVDPETGEITAVVGGRSTKLTFQDLQILRAAPEEGIYILRVDLHQAEEINHIIQVAPEAFSLVLRPGQDTRTANTDEFGETTESVIMRYVYPVPLLVDLQELLGLPITPVPGPIEPGPEPPQEPEPPEEPEEPEEPEP